MLKKPVDLEQEILEAERLNGLNLEKCIKVEKKNLNQHVLSPQDTGVTPPQSLQTGQENQPPISSTSTGTPGSHYLISSPPNQRIQIRIHRRRLVQLINLKVIIYLNSCYYLLMGTRLNGKPFWTFSSRQCTTTAMYESYII